jgi:hypothetical protein
MQKDAARRHDADYKAARAAEIQEFNRKRMGGRAVEGTGLENRQARKGLVGSNPTPSAKSAKLAH